VTGYAVHDAADSFRFVSFLSWHMTSNANDTDGRKGDVVDGDLDDMGSTVKFKGVPVCGQF
jgi:hypothetical protein